MSAVGDRGKPRGQGPANVVAIVGGLRTASRFETQTLQPDEVRQLRPENWDVMREAADAGYEWLWVLRLGGLPDPDALQRLVEVAAGRPGQEAPVVVAGLVVGSIDAVAAELPAPVPDIEGVVRAAPRRLLPIRNSNLANDLVHRDAIARHGVPRVDRFGRYAEREWTGRVLRTGGGWLIPGSRLAIDPPPRLTRTDALSEIRPAINTARSGTWTRGDGARALLDLARALARAQ